MVITTVFRAWFSFFFFIKSSRVCYYNNILWDTFSKYLYTVDVFFRRVTSAQLFITPPPPPDIRHLMWTLSKFIILYYSHTTNTYTPVLQYHYIMFYSFISIIMLIIGVLLVRRLIVRIFILKPLRWNYACMCPSIKSIEKKSMSM